MYNVSRQCVIFAAFKPTLFGLGLAAMMSAPMAPSQAMSLKRAIQIALDSNPNIGKAIENREAIEFELRQARGLFMPRLDLEGETGIRRLSSPTRRRTGLGNRKLYPSEVGLRATWKLFDGFGRQAEVQRQAARVDGASLRVLERSEFIALQVTKEYFELFVQKRLVTLARRNVGFHGGILRRIRSAEGSGTLTIADRRQAEERLAAAKARYIDANQELRNAEIRFLKLVARRPGKIRYPRSMARRLPRSLKQALGVASRQNPRLRFAGADVDSADALVRKAKSKMYPEVGVEGQIRRGSDIDGVAGRTHDERLKLVMKWNLYNGGIDKANIQEQVRRASEARYSRDVIIRELREAVRLSWNSYKKQGELSRALAGQVTSARRVVSAYDQQFSVGKRSLLDLLSAQNARFNGEALLVTARSASRYAQYRILAATGTLLSTLNLKAPSQAFGYARRRAGVPPTGTGRTVRRYSPPRHHKGLFPSGPL